MLVGIDWASDHHDVCLTHGSQGFERLHCVIKEHQPEQVLVALETTRGLLVHDLLRPGYQVYAVNPKPSAATKIATWCQKPKRIPSMLEMAQAGL
jgi:hypothetical protein